MTFSEWWSTWNKADANKFRFSPDFDEIWDAATKAEREDCANVCESRGPTLANSGLLAELIRMRSNKI